MSAPVATRPSTTDVPSQQSASFSKPLAVSCTGLTFRNPIVLASGTAGFGRELEDVMELDAVGGLSTKAVSVTPRQGNPALRVSEFAGGMINAIGLANPGLKAVREHEIGWMPRAHADTRLIVNVVGNTIEEFSEVVQGLDDVPGVDAFELNVSCPNVRAGGLEFGADPVALAALIKLARASTQRPLYVKLSPLLGAGVADMARVAVDAGADALTLLNTMPGLVVDTEKRKPKLSFGTGGMSGPAVLPMGVLATWRVRQATQVPLVGLGGVSTGDDALQYIMAGATLVGVGTAALRNPRAPARIVRELLEWCDTNNVTDIASLTGCLEFPCT